MLRISLILCGLVLAIAVVAWAIVRIDGSQSPGRMSVQCFRASDVAVTAAPALAIHAKTAFFATFRDPKLRKLPTGGSKREVTRGLVVFAANERDRRAAEGAYLAALARAAHVSPSVETAARAHVETHGNAFVQWDTAPVPNSSDRRVANACLGPITA